MLIARRDGLEPFAAVFEVRERRRQATHLCHGGRRGESATRRSQESTGWLPPRALVTRGQALICRGERLFDIRSVSTPPRPATSKEDLVLAAAVFAHRMAELGGDDLAEFGVHGGDRERQAGGVAMSGGTREERANPGTWVHRSPLCTNAGRLAG